MNRQEKEALVESMNETFKASPHMILATFSGLTVNQANELRRKISVAGGRYSVIKNRLAKRAAHGTAAELLMERFSGPCALVSHESDPVVLAKTLSVYAKDNPQLELLAGVVDAKVVLDVDGVKHLASLPGLQEVRAQILAMLNTPATTLVRLLGTPGTQLARVIDAHAEAQGGGSDD